MDYFVYLMASQRNGTLYAGVTSDLVKRVYQHRTAAIAGFTKEHNVRLLVWFDSTPSVHDAIKKEKQIKNWKREWKIALIEKTNPHWDDLYELIL